MALRPKNWTAFQHYKNRRPPWIRLYHSLLDDPDFWSLGSDAMYLIAIWLIASEHENGELPDTAKLAFRLRLPASKTKQLLDRLQAWFEKDASKTIATLHKDATPETEAEGETDAEGDASASAPPPQPLRVAECVRPDWESDEEATIPDDLPAAPLGNFLLQRLSIPHSYQLAVKFADCVGLVARDEGMPRGEAARVLLSRARSAPPPDGKWRFWLEDGGWKQAAAAGVSTEGWEQ